METLNISDQTARSESRWKTLFWPTLQNDVDVDTVTRQGFWLCAVVGVASLLFSAMAGQLAAGIIEGSFFFLAGIGVRRRSITAALGALAIYSLTTFILLRIGQFGVVRIFMMALLLANVRGIWLTARFRAEAQEPPPLPMDRTWSERLSDRLPLAVWPWGRWLFYLLLPLMLAGSVFVLVMPPR
ncbi:MAG: hypothetical protein K2X03_03435 [Bryobacteraceae bacterium]|nr:hypothetical protein [Bryobacteraceae bacterium]